MAHGVGKFGGGELTPVTVMFGVPSIQENTTQKIHTHRKTHTIHYTYRQTQFHVHKPTLITIIQLLPGARVISHIALIYK